MKMPALLLRPLRALAPAAALFLGLAAPRAFAQSATAADIAPANLPGKTITLNALVAVAPFQGTGIFTITFTATTYTMPVAAGNPAAFSGTYTAVSQSGSTLIRLNGYLVGGSPVQLVLVPQAAALVPGAFEMFADGVLSAKTGTFTVSGGGGGGGGGSGAPVITSASTATATVGTPFSYQITTSPAATSYTNTGGNAPVAISPGSGLVTGTFTTAGTFTFSFTALNAAGASAVTTVTVTVTSGSTGGGGSGGSSGTPATAVRAFGWNLSGQTTVPSTLTNIVQLAGTSQGSFALKSDGTLTAWGAGATTEAPTAGLAGVSAIAAASNAALALKTDGTLVQWGLTGDGQRTNFPTSGTFTAISGRYFHFLGVRSDGTVAVWGNDPAFPPLAQPPAGLTGVKAVAAGVGFDIALKADGTVVGWNSTNATYAQSATDKGQSRPPAGLSNVVAIAAGQFHALALKADGTVVGWGGTRTGAANSFTVPANAQSGVIAIACGLEHSVVLKSDGTIVAWGGNSFGETIVPAGLAGVTRIAAGEYFTLAATGGTAPSPGTIGGGTGGGGGGTAAQLGAGLVAYYKFEGNANDSVTSATGTLQGGVTYAGSRTGFGQAASFNGVNQFISIPHSAALNAGATGLSVSLWINTANPKAATNGSRLLDKATSGTADGWVFDTYDIARQSRNVVRVASTTIGANSSATFTGGAWQHLVFTYLNGTVNFYVNGVAAGSGNVGALVNNTLPLQLGAPRGALAGGEFFAGLMDELRIYNRVVTADEIAALASGDQSTTGGAPVFAAAPVNLVGYRNKVGQVFEFNVTGATAGAVWGTDVYTDDSSVAAAAVHAGVLRAGETKSVAITILPGQSSYAASARNGVSSAAWGAWSGSYSFAGAGAVTGTSVASARPAAAPGFTAGAGNLAVGGRFVCPILVTGGGVYTYQWYLNGLVIAGATANPYIVESVTTANAGTYSVDVTNSLGTTRITAGSLTVGAAGSPVIALQPISKVVVPGATVTFAVNASGSNLAYQWFRNNVALAGETGAILRRDNVNAADAGTYTVRVTNAAGSVTSLGGTLTLNANASRPANISVRTNVATGAIVTPGFVIQGGGTKRVLIRAVGPGLAQFGLGGVMADPKFTVFQGQTQIATNDDWSAANIGQAFTATGAFPITAGSKDAALVTDLAAGKDYTVQVTNATGAGGIVIIEVYDADVLTGASTSKLVNVSVRGQTAPGADVLTLGLVIGGQGQRTLLVRGVGPTLAAFGVGGTVADPRLQIFDSQQRAILANDDWGTADFVNELALASSYVGAFNLAPGSKDAATLTLLDPGAYTIQVSGAESAPRGEALVEVYEVP